MIVQWKGVTVDSGQIRSEDISYYSTVKEDNGHDCAFKRGMSIV